MQNLRINVDPIFAILLFLVSHVAAAEIDSERQQQLSHLLKHDCGSCHGMTLKGGLGPALTNEALRTQSLDQIINVIRYGRPGTPMPPWETLLSAQDIEWLAKRLKQGAQQ